MNYMKDGKVKVVGSCAAKNFHARTDGAVRAGFFRAGRWSRWRLLGAQFVGTQEENSA